jgi:hypothetical protein
MTYKKVNGQNILKSYLSIKNTRISTTKEIVQLKMGEIF